MKNLSTALPLLYILICTLAACNRYDYENGEIKEPTHEYKEYAVDFFDSHKDFVLKPVVFEAVTEQVLLKPAHKQGATFEVVTEQIMVKSSFREFKIMDSTALQLVVDAEIGEKGEISCYHFLKESDFIEITRPAVFQTLFNEILLENGTGASVPASYGTISKAVIAMPASISPNTADQTFKRVLFRIPANQSIRAYLDSEFLKQSITNCTEGDSYRINE